VEAGEVLVILANIELRTELADLELEIENSRLLCRAHEQNDRLAAYQAEWKRRESLEKQYQQKKNEVEQLTVRAPIAGQIIGRNLDALRGTYMSQGAEILSIGSQQAKEIQVSVAQEDLETFANHLKKPVMVRVGGACRFLSVLDTVSPRASMVPLHAALCSPHGGPLAVRRQAADSDTPPRGSESYELLAPRFLAVVALDQRHGSPLRAGQRGVASFWDGSDTIGKHLYKKISCWIRKKFAQASTTS
jgi:putative peptide zinc metalloprotease protein